MQHRLMPKWAHAIPDAENTVRVMEEAPCLIVVLNTNQKTPFANISGEDRIVEICDSLSIGAAVENMMLTANTYGLGTLQTTEKEYRFYCRISRVENSR